MKQKMYSYSAYGLGIRCAIPLPNLIESDAPADVVMRFGQAKPINPIAENAGLSLQFSDNKAFFFYRGLGSGEAIAGREIIGTPEEGLHEGLMSFLAQGPGLSVLLHQRGYLTLHASCVKIGNRAAAFMGDSGTGKSTIAAALHIKGHAVVSDDVTVINSSTRELEAYPGYPGLHLLPDGADHFRDQLGKPEKEDADDPKFKFSARTGFPKVPVPIGRIYLLSDGPDLQISSVSRPRAVYELVKHSYWIRFMQNFRPSSYFLQCAELCSRIPIVTLRRARIVSALGEIAETVEKDFLDSTRA
ncbi:MAG: hypothetical protein WBG50_24545 [Desulfomonilaceae bacterium]